MMIFSNFLTSWLQFSFLAMLISSIIWRSLRLRWHPFLLLLNSGLGGVRAGLAGLEHAIRHFDDVNIFFQPDKPPCWGAGHAAQLLDVLFCPKINIV